ncbi:MAG: (d)CMP kinase [Elusimicrobiales bacterium]
MRKNGIIIAIDGPAGAGKTSVGKAVAEKIAYRFISTGKMYRAIAWLCKQECVDVSNEKEVVELAKKNPISFVENNSVELDVEIAGIRLDRELYLEEIADATSAVAKLKDLREFFVEEQRRIGRDGGIVMEGRDITTNVFPDAELKIYLDASPQARAERRVRQLESKGIKADYNEILSMILKRDHQDSTRKENPLLKSSDSIYIDTTSMSQQEVVNLIVNLYKQKIDSKI